MLGFSDVGHRLSPGSGNLSGGVRFFNVSGARVSVAVTLARREEGGVSVAGTLLPRGLVLVWSGWRRAGRCDGSALNVREGEGDGPSDGPPADPWVSASVVRPEGGVRRTRPAGPCEFSSAGDSSDTAFVTEYAGQGVPARLDQEEVERVSGALLEARPGAGYRGDGSAADLPGHAARAVGGFEAAAKYGALVMVRERSVEDLRGRLSLAPLRGGSRWERWRRP